jgi:hypothetical protein
VPAHVESDGQKELEGVCCHSDNALSERVVLGLSMR